jgi:hypothetical protein
VGEVSALDIQVVPAQFGGLHAVEEQRSSAARLAELTERAAALARGARAESTWAAYTGQWRRFETWCARMGERALPADPLTVARFLRG